MKSAESLEKIACEVILDDNSVHLKNIKNAVHKYQHALDSWKIPCKEVIYKKATRL